MEKKCINICINSIKNYISLDKFDILKIDIDTKSDYYKINILYNRKNDKSMKLFLDYFLDKEHKIVLHCFSNDIRVDEIDKQNVDYKTEKENYELKDIIKIFYYKDKWHTVYNIAHNDDKKLSIFKNKDDFYEILNKNVYYTYNIKNNKFIFLSKGIKNDINQSYNENISDIFQDDKIHVIIKNKKQEKKEFCKYKLNCIDPNCNFSHPINYDINTAYKLYIIEERKKNPKFKSLKCSNNDKKCLKHKYNKCIFIHNNDPIEQNKK
jgi:hypothetical protein